jgi:hypothetical protein
MPAKAIAIATLWVCGLAHAAPNEIKVFTDELANLGEQTLETHVNKASSPGPNVENRANPLRIMPEYSYGVRQNWEFSLQLPLAFTTDQARLEGYRAELQYIAPHDDEEGFYWGMNFEVARIERMGEQSFWNAEVIPIFGYRWERWHFVANPGFDKPLSGSSRSSNFGPALKAAYRVFEKNYFGLEYYQDLGPLKNNLPKEEQSRVLYIAWDGKIGKSDINVGLGRGLTDSSDRWVLKMIYEFTF